MPFLRVVRDKRGYETTYLMHLYREGHRQRSRILYVFRSPAGVRVGREALEPDVLREIETRYPDITFDWKQVRQTQQHIEMSAEPRRRRLPKAGAPTVAGPGDQPAARSPHLTAHFTVPASIQGSTPEERMRFLTEWYGLIREHIPARTSSPVRQRALHALTECLNTTTWTDADQITAGLEHAATALERLSRILSRRHRPVEAEASLLEERSPEP